MNDQQGFVQWKHWHDRTQRIAGIVLVAGCMTVGAIPARALETQEPTTMVAQSTQIGWQSIKPEGGRFNIEMPRAPQTTRQTTAIVDQSLNWTIYQVRDGAERFAIAYTDLPLSVLGEGREAFVESLRNQLLARDFDWQAIRDRSRRISLNGVPGVEYFNIRNGQISSLRLYLAKRRLYALFATSNDIARTGQFMDSFAVDSLWQPFVSENGRFTVDLPMAPSITQETTQHQGKALQWTKFEARNIYDREDSYVVAYTDLPAGTSPQDSAATLAEASRNTLNALGLSGFGGVGRSITVNGQPGREYIGSTHSGRAIVIRFYLVGSRLYGIYANSKSLSNLNPFLNSFNIR